jgi:Holliday junction resolvase RusA-like endonuclease
MPTFIEFAAPDVLLSLNDRLHWSKRASITRHWRSAAHWAAIRTGPMAGPCLVNVTFVVKVNRRRDPSNLIATVKAIVDGLTDAGLWPDDDSSHVSVAEPVVVTGPKGDWPLVVVRIDPLVLA